MIATTQDKQIQVRAEAVSKVIQAPDGPLTILADLDFAATAGEAVAILGASGSGKSTLLSLLAGLDSSTTGRIHLLDTELSALNEDARAALRAGRVGFVFQNFQLLPGFTALENILLPLELNGVKNPLEEARQALAQVGLTARAGHYPRQLSGGEQQRVAIARAMASRPSVLFADEPTGNLDPHTGAQIIQLLLELRRQSHTTLILVTHDETLATQCDRRLLLDQGRLVPL